MQYIGYILGAYGTALLLLASLIVATWWRARSVDAQLRKHGSSKQS